MYFRLNARILFLYGAVRHRLVLTHITFNRLLDDISRYKFHYFWLLFLLNQHELSLFPNTQQ